MADPVRVNGNMYSWGSIIVKIDGDPYTGFTSIAYADKRERVKGYGMGRHHSAIGRSRGKYTTDPVKLTGRKGAVRILIAALAARAADGRAYGDVQFEIAVQFVETAVNGGEQPINDTLEGCVITAVNASHEESADPLSEDIEIDVMRIRRGEATLWDATGDGL